MVKQIFVFALILLSAALAFSQSKSSEAIEKQLKSLKAEKVFSLIYDKDSDNSKILGFSEDFGREQDRRNDVSSFRFGLAFLFVGKNLKSVPGEYLMTFQAGTKRTKFAAAHNLKFTIDNEILDLGDARYANKNEGIEYLNFKINREQLAKLAKAKNAAMKIGGAEFTLSAAQIKMFADLFALSDLSPV